MNLSFSEIINWISSTFFGGSTTLTGLALLVGIWAIMLVILINAKAAPAYSVVPMIPAAIFLAGYGILNETISILIVIIAAAFVAVEMKKVVD